MHFNKLDIFKRDGFRCRYCGFDGTTFENYFFLEIDHINPKGPRLDPSNVATACHRCNDWKFNDPCANVEEAKAIIARHREANLRYWEKNVIPLVRECRRIRMKSA
jgi:5-methylcytosine-specific restriction endonuclease McrA